MYPSLKLGMRDKNNEKSDDKHNGIPVDVNDVKQDNESDEFYRNQDGKRNSKVLGGVCSDKEVVKGIDVLTIVPLLQVILAMMLYSVKSLQDRSLQIA